MKSLRELVGRPVGSVLCLGAHSDDIEIGCGGTLLTLLAQAPGVRVHWIVLSAESGRREEAIQSAQTLLGGADSKIQVCDFEDRYFPAHAAAIKRVFDDLSESVAPDLVFTHYREDLHQDHRLVAELTWNTFRDHHILEYEIPKYDGDLGRPNLFVQLSRSVCESKVEHLLQAFPTQAGKPWYSAETFRALLRLRGIECRSASGYAEAFHARKLLLW